MNAENSAVLLGGATGLIGGHCLTVLLKAPHIRSIVPVVRRPIHPRDPRLAPLVADFASLDSKPPVDARVALCAVGTTIKQAGSKAGFRTVDYEAVLAFAHFAARSGVETFGLVSSVGASRRSHNFYLRIKGETEEAVAALGFRSFVAMRPSLLLGERTESRPGEAISQKIYPLFTPLLQGPTRRFRAIPATIVAGALASLAVLTPPDGRHIWYYDDIIAARLTT